MHPGDEHTAPTDPRIAAFLQHLASERKFSAHTVLAYRRDIALLVAQLDGTDLADVDVHIARRSLNRLRLRSPGGQGLGPRSLARALSAWRRLYRFLTLHHGLARNPFQGLRAPRAAKHLPKALSPGEASKLLQFDGSDVLAARDLAMFELFYSSGLRLSELTALRIGDFDFAEETVRVLGKGSKPREVPVGKMALEALRAWLARRAELLRMDTDRVFLSRDGRPLSNRSVQQRLRARAQQQALTQGVHPHMLRHSFASHVLQSSGDLRAVQEMLGHASLSTTQVYTHLDFQHLAKVYDNAHPRAKKK